MVSDQMSGFVGALVGGGVGILGGVVGTYCSIRNTSGPRQRQYMVRTAVVGWLGILLFLAMLLVLPNPWRWLLWVPYGLLLPAGIITSNRRLAQIRREETAGPGPR